MASWLRQLETFLDDCDQDTADVLNDYFGFEPAAESISALLSLDADTLQAAAHGHDTATTGSVNPP